MLCEDSGVSSMRPRLAVIAALTFSRLTTPTGAAEPSMLRLTPTRPEDAAPTLQFSLPKYTLTSAEREIVAACLVLEAANQGDFGMRGVMAVIRNRARGLPELFAPTVLRPKQFTALNRYTSGQESRGRLLARAQRDPTWATALRIVDDAVHDSWHDPTAGATHYTRVGERTAWTRRLAKTVIIGAHMFYR
jgi:spore germination cell wall hydrolase CwlJ-like protein